VVFLTLGVGFKTPAWVAAVVCIAVTFLLRIATVIFNITTNPVHDHALRTRAMSTTKAGVRKVRNR